MQYKNFFKSELKNLKDQGLYRDFRNIDRPIKSFPNADESFKNKESCLLYTSPSPRDRISSRMPSSA